MSIFLAMHEIVKIFLMFLSLSADSNIRCQSLGSIWNIGLVCYQWGLLNFAGNIVWDKME